MLVANNSTEKKILEFFLQNSDAALRSKVEIEGRTLAGAVAYATKLAKDRAENGVACIDSETVFSWCMHYFQDLPIADVRDAAKSAPVAVVKTSPEVKNEVKSEEKNDAPEAEAPKRKHKGKPRLREGVQLDMFEELFANA